ncbi:MULTISPECIES: hypothetical protein [unclassified Paraburkholderia]|uniref:hypothetical protein n=1 Tax=unclassified Paraburkholderia TaxID=2615204 RepID=UPI00165520E5|nr:MULTISPECIES: hypothetical protein [unclassified Paraburkholderia]
MAVVIHLCAFRLYGPGYCRLCTFGGALASALDLFAASVAEFDQFDERRQFVVGPAVWWVSHSAPFAA